MKNKDLFIYQGDTHRFRISLSVAGAPLDVAAAEWRFTLKTPSGDYIQPDLSIDGDDVMLVFSAAMTAQFDWQAADYDLRAAFGDVVKTYLTGRVLVTPSIGELAADGVSAGQWHDERVDVAISADGVVIAANQTDSADLAALSARLNELAEAVANADPAPRLAELMQLITQAQAEAAVALEAANTKADSVALTSLSARLNELAETVANQDQTERVAELAQSIETLQTEIQTVGDLAQGLADVEQLNSRFAAALEELAQLRQQVDTLPPPVDVSADLAEIRTALNKKPLREKIHITQEMWAAGGYAWARVKFQNEYKDPKIHIQLEHLVALPVLFLNYNLSEKTGTGVAVRSNFSKAKIDVDYSVYLYVEEMAAA